MLQQCGDDLTRDNVHQAGHFAEERCSTDHRRCRASSTATTPATDYRVNKQLQMMKFNGERWELFGPILEDAGPAG